MTFDECQENQSHAIHYKNLDIFLCPKQKNLYFVNS